MFKPIAVKALKKYVIWVKYEDGSEGKVDLSHFAGKPMFQFWEEDKNFEKVYIDETTGAIAWNDEIDFCPDSIYIQINNIDPEKYFSKESSSNAKHY